MTTLREAAQQALEALVDAQNHNYALKHKEADQLINALRAALAQEQAEPQYWGVFEGCNLGDFFTVRQMAVEMAYYKGSHATVGPLYTAPPQRTPLTDEEIKRIHTEWRASVPLHLNFARAIETEVLKRMGVQK